MWEVCLAKYHTMKIHERVEIQLHIFLTSVLNGDEYPALGPSCLTPREIAPSTHWIGG